MTDPDPVTPKFRQSPGRFLEVDPVEGGSANDYDYVYADPINDRDLTGLWCGPRCLAKKAAKKAAKAARSTGNAVKGAGKSVYRGAAYVGGHLGTGGSLCVGVCVSLGTKGGHFFFTGGNFGLGASVDLYVFQGPACKQGGLGISSSVVAGVGGGSSASLDDDLLIVPETSGISISGGAKIVGLPSLPFSGGVGQTWMSGC